MASPAPNLSNSIAVPGSISPTNDIRALKPPVEIPAGWAWLGWAAALLAMVAALILLRRWARRRAAHIPAARAIPPAEKARKRLEAALALISDAEPFCVAVSDAIRCYFEDQFSAHAPDRTTEEFLNELGGAPYLNNEQRQALAEFLTRCDLVKFARYEPPEAELRGLYGSAMHLVNATEPPPLAPAQTGPERQPIAS